MITSKFALSNQLIDGHPKSVHKRRINGHFVKGPIPLSWISKAALLPGKSLNVGLACFYLMGLKRSHSFKLSNVVAAQFGLNKDSKARALKHLEKAGLVRCFRKQGRSVVVEVLSTNA